MRPLHTKTREGRRGMSPTQVEVQGTLGPDGTLVLDERPNLPPGRVRVVIPSRTGAVPARENLLDFVQRVHQSAVARGGWVRRFGHLLRTGVHWFWRNPLTLFTFR